MLALPVQDIDQAAQWYGERFGLREVRRHEDPVPTVVMERDGVQIGFAVNGGDASNDGAAILVGDVHRAREELEANGVATGAWRVDERDGKRFPGVLVVAPDQLCYYFHQPID